MFKNKLIVFSGSNAQGGAENQLCRLLEKLETFEIVLIFFSREKNLGTFEKLGLKKNIELFQLNFSNPIKFLNNFIDVLEIISIHSKKSIILGWLAKGNIFSLIIGLIKFKETKVFCSHRSQFGINQSFQSRLLLFISLGIFRIYPKKIVHIINSKEIVSSSVIKFFLRSKPICIKNSFDYEEFIDSSFIKKQNHKLLKLLVVARFSKEKGYELLFKALNKINIPFELKCIGKGCNYKNHNFKKLCDRYNIYPIIIETSKDLRKEYQKCDFLVQSSYSEAFPNVVVESILEGTPVISTPTGPFKNTLKKYGLITEKFDAHHHARSIKDAFALKNNPQKYEKTRRDLRLDIVKLINTQENFLKSYTKAFLEN